MTKTLLQQAASLPPHRNDYPRRRKILSKEHQRLAVAWLDDEITYSQLERVLNLKGSNVYNFLAGALRAARKSKLI